MKTWNELNKEFTEERLKEKPNVENLELLHIEMLNTFKETKGFNNAFSISYKVAKYLLLTSIALLIALLIF
jgi:hypothetical protein